MGGGVGIFFFFFSPYKERRQEEFWAFEYDERRGGWGFCGYGYIHVFCVRPRIVCKYV
jgi:hypothetical protein